MIVVHNEYGHIQRRDVVIQRNILVREHGGKAVARVAVRLDEAGCRADAYPGARQVASYDVRHPEIIQDRGKCVKCAVCVKVCKEVVNQSLLSLQKRGFQSMVGTAFNAGLPLSCKDCGKCIESCPTGALDWRKKR